MKTKYKTIPFDVERAKRISNGEEEGKIVTRDGKEVRIICFDVKNDKYPIIGLVKEGDKEAPETFKKNGIYAPDEKECEYDLFLSVPEWTTFKDGDIIYCKVDNGNNSVCKWVSILKGKVEYFDGDLYTDEYATYIIEPNTYKGEMSFDGYSDNIDTIVFANESQKQYFIELLKKSKDPKAKEYLKRFFRIKEKNVYEFKPFDKVLVRDDKNKNWLPKFFEKYTNSEDYRFRCMNGTPWKYCIPYEGNEHLLGTSNNPE